MDEFKLDLVEKVLDGEISVDDLVLYEGYEEVLYHIAGLAGIEGDADAIVAELKYRMGLEEEEEYIDEDELESEDDLEDEMEDDEADDLDSEESEIYEDLSEDDLDVLSGGEAEETLEDLEDDEILELMEDQDVDEYDESFGEPEEDEVLERDTVYNSDGQPVENQVEGEMWVDIVELDKIVVPPRTRKIEAGNECIEDLETNILQWGLICPLHVIPYKDDKYLLVHGFRRLRALKNLKYHAAACLIDTTRESTTIRFLEVLSNNSLPYKFTETMDFGDYVERKQCSFQNDTIEKIVGMNPGDYLKAKYILQHDVFGISGEIEMGKLSIGEGFKKLEKEIEKAEKKELEMQNMAVDERGLPIDVLEDDSAYEEIVEEEANVQSTKDRKPLPPHVYANIKARDQYTCQTCGLGYEQPELNSIHEVHHIIPVFMGGSDDESNLILLCSNCHKLVGAYIDGRFKIPKDSQDTYSNIILLGNIALKGVGPNMTAIDIYNAKCSRPWLSA